MCDCDMANSNINASAVQTVKHNEVRAKRNSECTRDVGIMFHQECNHLFTRYNCVRCVLTSLRMNRTSEKGLVHL
jgi:hypothetical protein